MSLRSVPRVAVAAPELDDVPEELLRERGGRAARAAEGRAALGNAREEARQVRRRHGAALLAKDAEHEQLDARGASVGRPAARRADRGEEVGRGYGAVAPRDGLGVSAVEAARVERRAAAQEQLAHGVVSAPGAEHERRAI